MNIFIAEMYRDDTWSYGIRVVDGILVSHWMRLLAYPTSRK